MGTSKVRVTGGEPSLRKDLPAIIAACANTQGIEHVAMTTNGYKLESDIQKWVDAGLNSLNISIDSLDPRMFESITGHDKLTSILSGIDKALALGVKVKVNAVLLKQYNSVNQASASVSELFKFVKLNYKAVWSILLLINLVVKA